MKARQTTARTRVKVVKGILHYDDGGFELVPVTVRVTSDKIGKSVSLAVEKVENPMMIQIAIESVADMLAVVE